VKTIQPNDVVLGYRLISRIGTGGYGEVWRADAPGGIAKAVKFVYGYHDEERAKGELKSLERIKEVRHPFLLSLERIQVVAGQLVVITELADRSLADRFREVKAATETGIPREELVAYLRDAADGLDYLSKTHNLQHLDIKPENLLLLSGHVKIADFGLVKEVRDAAQTLMSGLTPIYAPPELFDGRPHRNSDQYSLAIVYQEMLTGTRPFTGSSAAQLAAQHINARPGLQALPIGDQPVIARALAKDPNLRFLCCRDLVDALSERKVRSAPRKVRSTANENSDTIAGVVQQNDSKPREFTAVVSPSAFPHLNAATVMLPPLDLSQTRALARPTLIVGLGRTGIRVLSRVRKRLRQLFGPAQRWPALAMLAIDTDLQALTQRGPGMSGPELAAKEILPVTLRPSESYRHEVGERLHWLSRRWIYNIPRSGQTEGLRPLGRLAFADHFEKITRRLNEMVAQVIKPEAVAATAESIGLDPDLDRVNVFLVGSSAGGIGSGMMLDMAYAIRNVLEGHGVPDLRLVGLLAHCLPRNPDQQLLAVSNSLSLLGELRHFNDYGYPGDDGLGLPAFEDVPAFDHTMFLHLGDGLSTQSFDEGLESIGEYIFLNVATQCQAFCETCRSEDGAGIRSMQLRSHGLSQGQAFDVASRELAAELLNRWSSTQHLQPANPSANSESPGQLPQVCPAHIHQAVNQATGQHRELARTTWQEAFNASRRLPMGDAVPAIQTAAAQLAERLGLHAESAAAGPFAELRAAIERRAREMADAAEACLWRLVSEPAYRLGGAINLAGHWLQQLAEAAERHRATIRDVGQRKQDALLALPSILAPQRKGATAAATPAQWSDSFFGIGLDGLEATWELHWIRGVTGRLEEAQLALKAAATDLRIRLSDCLPLPNDEGHPPQSEGFPLRQINTALRARLDDLVDRADTQLERGWLHTKGGLSAVLRDPQLIGRELPAVFTEACQAAIAIAQRDLPLSELATAAQMDSSALAAWMATQIADTKPRLAEVGGEIRLMIALSGHPAADQLFGSLKIEHPLQPTLLAHVPSDLVFCQELGKVTLMNLVYRIMEKRPEALDLVARLHTRTDIEWSNLNQLFQLC
jgi:serine/threonine protein kinase